MNIDKKYKELLSKLTEPKTYSHSGDKTIYYLTFDPDDIIQIKRNLNDTWVELAHNKGLEVSILSLYNIIADFFKQDEYRIDAGADATVSEEETKDVYASLGENLKNQEIIENAILKAQENVSKNKNGVLFITDIEAIHPFTRFGPIEQRIYNKLKVPVVVFYPGEKIGTALKFLSFYPEDGNYRSEHI